MIVLLLPPKAFISNFVSTESRKGIRWFLLWLFIGKLDDDADDDSARAWMQWPRHWSDWLMATPSLKRSPLVFPVPALLTLSLQITTIIFVNIILHYQVNFSQNILLMAFKYCLFQYMLFQWILRFFNERVTIKLDSV
jgi:hypothetical protein